MALMDRGAAHLYKKSAMVVRLSRFFGDGMVIPPFNEGILIMGPYKPLRTWVDTSLRIVFLIGWRHGKKNGRILSELNPDWLMTGSLSWFSC